MTGTRATVKFVHAMYRRLDIRTRNRRLLSRRNPGSTRVKAPLGRHPLRKRTQGRYLSAKPRQVAPVQSAPRIVKGFKGIADTGWTPPDTMGAAGVKHLVSIVNGGFAVFNKLTGSRLISLTLQDFWSEFGTQRGQPAYFVYDPKVLYDTFSSRFVIVSIGGNKTSEAPGSWILFSVSEPNNPFIWHRWAVESDPNSQNWSDYPGIGLDKRYTYITANMFRNEDFQYVKVWVIPKQQLLNGIAKLKLFEFSNPPGSEFTTQPTQVYGLSTNRYYLVAVRSGKALKVYQITFTSGVPVWRQVRTVQVHPFPFPQVPKAKQKGTTNRIETNDVRLLNAVFRNGSIYTTHHVASHDKMRVEVAWYQLNPTKATPVQQGRIRDDLISYYYPSIAVDVRQNILIGFNGSSPKQYASAYFTGRRATDPAGTMRSITLLKAGVSPYLPNRWGDFSATVVDPSGGTFWTVQEYALKPHDWGTWWGQVQFRANGGKATSRQVTPR